MNKKKREFTRFVRGYQLADELIHRMKGFSRYIAYIYIYNIIEGAQIHTSTCTPSKILNLIGQVFSA